MKECVFKQIEGTVPPDFQEIIRTCEALERHALGAKEEIGRHRYDLRQINEGRGSEFCIYKGTPISIIGRVAQLGRICRYLERLFALDLETMKSPYMQRNGE